MRSSHILILLVVLTLALAPSQLVLAQANQLSSTINLTNLSVVLTYPSETQPGQSITVNVQATAKESFHLTSLVVQVFLADGSNLRQLTSSTVQNNRDLYKGDQINNSLQATVPSDAPRTSLVALASETTSTPSYNDYSSVYYPYPYYSYQYYPYYNNYPYYDNYTYYYYPAYYYYPSYTYVSTTDDGIAPLSYVKAATPEYVSLQSAYQSLQQQLNLTQAQNQQLKQDNDAKQSTISQQNSVIDGLNQQLASTKNNVGLLEIIVLVLAAVVVVLGVYSLRGRSKQPAEPAPPQPAKAPEQESTQE